MHGKVSEIRHTGRSASSAASTAPFQATRYHSLTIAPETMPAVLEVTAGRDDDVIMGVMHKTHPVHGVQFHPESIASEHGHQILKNFLDIAAGWNARHRVERRSPEEATMADLKALIGKVAAGKRAHPRRGARRLRHHHVGRGDAGRRSAAS